MKRRATLLCLPLLLVAARAEARGCAERSEIVGRQRCSRFGDRWDVSRSVGVVVGIGPSIASFPVNGLAFTGALATRFSERPGLHVNGDALGRWTSAGAKLRLAVFAPRAFYLGVEGEVAEAAFPRVAFSPSAAGLGAGGPTSPYALRASSAHVRTLGAIAGVSLPAWRFDFSVEVLGGVHALSPNFDWRALDAANAAAGGCWTGPKGATRCPFVDSGWAYVARVEPRAGIAFRIQPWITLRTLAGVDPLAHASWTATALLELHTRAYDGFYQRRRVVEE